MGKILNEASDNVGISKEQGLEMFYLYFKHMREDLRKGELFKINIPHFGVLMPTHTRIYKKVETLKKYLSKMRKYPTYHYSWRKVVKNNLKKYKKLAEREMARWSKTRGIEYQIKE